MAQDMHIQVFQGLVILQSIIETPSMVAALRQGRSITRSLLVPEQSTI